MDMMEIRRRVMEAMASGGAKVKTGTFGGNGTKTVTIPCDFYPDVILVALNNPASRPAEYIGNVYEVIWRDTLFAAFYDMQTANNNKNAYVTYSDAGHTGYNNQTYSTRDIYAIVDGSSVQIDHNTGSNTFAYYVEGYTYSYTFIKYTE